MKGDQPTNPNPHPHPLTLTNEHSGLELGELLPNLIKHKTQTCQQDVSAILCLCRILNHLFHRHSLPRTLLIFGLRAPVPPVSFFLFRYDFHNHLLSWPLLLPKLSGVPDNQTNLISKVIQENQFSRINSVYYLHYMIVASILHDFTMSLSGHTCIWHSSEPNLSPGLY